MHVLYAVAASLAVTWIILCALTEKSLGSKGAAWYWACELFALAVLLPVGLVVVGAASICKAWAFPYATSIKQLTDRRRIRIDGWRWPINLIYGNPEDGVSGVDAYGPNWEGSYNPYGTRWRAFKWSALRNWANGFNYVTWRSTDPAPFYSRQYSVFGKTRQLKIGWQQLPSSDGWVTNYRVRMVCSA